MALCMVDHGRQTRSIRALEDSHLETRQGRVRSPSSCASSDGDDSVVFGAKRSSTTTTITTDAGPSSASVPTALGSVVDKGRKRSARLSRRDTVVVRPDVVAVSLLDGSSSSSSSPVLNRQSTTGEQCASPLRVSSPLRMGSPLVSATPNKTSSPLKPTHARNGSRPSSPFPSTYSNANDDQQNSPRLPRSSPRSPPSTPSNVHFASPLRPGSSLRFATGGVGSRPGTPSGRRAFWPVQDDVPVVQDEEQLQRMLRVVVKEGRMALATEVGRVGSYEEERVRALGDYDDATTYTGFFDEAHTIQNHAATQEHDEEDESLPHMPYVTMRDLQPPVAALELLHSTNSTTVETEHMFHHTRRAIDYDDDELTDTDSPWEVDEVSFAAGSGREGDVDMQGVGLDEGMVKCFEEFGFGEEGEAEEQGEAEGKEVERGLEESDELGEEEEGERENHGNETESESEAEQDDFDLFNPVDEAQQLVTPAEEADSPDNEEVDDVAVDHETEQEEYGEGTPERSIPSSPSPSPENGVDTELECDDGLPEQSAERAVPVPFRPVQHPESSSTSSTSSTEEHQDTEEETASSDVVETPAAKSPAPSPTKTPVVPSVVKEQWPALTAAPTTRRQLAKPREIFKPVTKGGQLKSRLGGGASSAVPVPRAMLVGPSTSTQASSSTNSAVPSASSSPASKRVALTSKKVVPAPTATARPVVVRKIASPTRLVKAKVPIPSSSATVPSTRLPSATTKPVTKQTVPRSKPTLTEGTSSTIPSSHLAATTAPASPRRSPRKPSPPTDHHARSNSSASTASSSSTTAAPVAATRPRVMAAPGASATRVAAAAARRAAAASTANENMAKKPGPRPAMTTTLRTNHTIVASEGRVVGAPSATTLARQPLGRPGSRIIAGPSASNIAAALVRRPASALSTASTASSVEVTVQQSVVPVAMPPAPSTPVAGCPPAPELPLLPRPAPLASAAPRSPEKKAQRVKDGVVTTKVDLEIARPPSALGTASRGLAKTPSLVSAGYTSPIRSKPQLLPPPLPLPRTGLFGPGPTAFSDSILTASTESLDSLTSAVAAKDVFAPSAPARELLPPPLPRPTRQTKLLTEDRVAPATPVLEQPTALLPRPVRRKQPSIDTTETLTPRPVLTFQPAPVLTQDELTRLTQRNTKKNQLHFNHHQVIVTHLEVPRPPSPTSKIRKSIGEHGVSGATSVGREARAAKRRNALRSSTDGSEVDLLNSELDAARGAFAAGDGVVRVEQLKTTHYRAPGDEEQYSSPVRPSTSSNGNKKRGSGATKKTSVGSAPARRVKWDKALVYEGPMEGQGEVKVDGILKVKAPLDSFGNLTVNNGSLGKAVPVQIKKLIYIDDPPE